MSKCIVHGANEIEAVINRNSASIYKLAYLRVGNKHDAEDITQDVFLSYLKNSPIFENTEHEKAWFLRVTVNKTNSFFSSAWKRRTVDLNDEIAYCDEYDDSTVLERVMALPKNISSVIHLYYYENYSVKEISEIVGKSESAVKALLMRGRNMLKIELTEDGYSNV